MLKPLDSEVLAALQSPDKYAGCARVSSAKYKLGENKDVRNCVYALLQVYSTTFEARLRWKGDDVNNRWVDFRDSPFHHLRLVSGSDTAIDIYEFGECIESFEILGCPHNWVKMLQWVWNYGYERLIGKAKNGWILPLLDLELYIAVAHEKDDAGSPILRQAHSYFANKHVAEGVYMLLLAFQLCSPQLHREAMNPETWHISFKESPLRTLRIQPDTDRRGIVIYASNNMVKFFCLVDSPPRDPLIGDLETRQRLIEWIWDYGNQRIAGRLKYEEKQSKIKSKAKTTRTETLLLHKVLHTARFKAQHVKSSKAKTVKLNLQQKDDVMEDIEEVSIDESSDKP